MIWSPRPEVAGPGFINISLKPAAWAGALRAAIGAGADYGRGNLAPASRSMSNMYPQIPTGPMHIGHTRGAVFGDALANLLAFSGYAVTRENFTPTTPAHRSTCFARSCILALSRSARRNYLKFPKVFIRAII